MLIFRITLFTSLSLHPVKKHYSVNAKNYTQDIFDANDKIFEFSDLSSFKQKIFRKTFAGEVSPDKTIKLHQMIQNQPSYLFEGNIIGSGENTLYLVFSQFHYISHTDLKTLSDIFSELKLDTKELEIYKGGNIEELLYYRNWDNPDEVFPKATLMAYNSQNYFKFSLFYLKKNLIYINLKKKNFLLKVILKIKINFVLK